MIHVFAFYLFATLCIFSGAVTILARNPVHSVLWLILAFFNAAGLMVLVGAEFIAMLLVIVYVGAVAVLFLFVVMMLDIDFAALRAGFVSYFPLGGAIALVLLVELVLGIGAWQAGTLNLAQRAAPLPDATPNIEAIGQLLYTRYIFIFEAAGLVLLVVVYVGAVAVLFLFVVMMLDVDFAALRQGFARYMPIGLLISAFLAAEMVLVATTVATKGAAKDAVIPLASGAGADVSNAEAIGRVLYTDYIYFFQASGLVLLVAMIGAIVLTLRHKPGVRRQSIADQVARTKKSGMVVVQIKPGEGIGQ